MFDPVPSLHWFLGHRASSFCVLFADRFDSELHWPVSSLLFSPRLSSLLHWAHRARFPNFSCCIILVLRCPFVIFLNAYYFFAEVFWLGFFLLFFFFSIAFEPVHNFLGSFLWWLFSNPYQIIPASDLPPVLASTDCCFSAALWLPGSWSDEWVFIVSGIFGGFGNGDLDSI